MSASDSAVSSSAASDAASEEVAWAAAAARPAAPQRTLVWGIPFDHVTLQEAVERIGRLIERGKPSFAITANLNYVMLHHQRGDVAAVTGDADLIVADGQPIVWRSQWEAAPLPERVAGSEMIHRLAELAAEKQWGIYFLGGAPGVASACAERLADRHPGLRIAGVESPPFRPLSAEEQAAQDARIRDSAADLLLVAFGQPKGECWIHQHYQRLGVPVSIQLGASFDFIAGTVQRAPESWQHFGLEWAYRMFRDPRRLVPRYLSNALFLVHRLIDDGRRLGSGVKR